MTFIVTLIYLETVLSNLNNQFVGILVVITHSVEITLLAEQNKTKQKTLG